MTKRSNCWITTQPTSTGASHASSNQTPSLWPGIPDQRVFGIAVDRERRGERILRLGAGRVGAAREVLVASGARRAGTRGGLRQREPSANVTGTTACTRATIAGPSVDSKRPDFEPKSVPRCRT